MSEPAFNATRVLARKKPDPLPHAGWRRWINVNMFGVLLLLATCLWSVVRVLSINHTLNDPSVITVRICHWQLEAGFREAMQGVIDDYNRLKQGQVRVIQMGVSEKVYAEWLNVNLIADNAPDLSEMGQARLVTGGESVAKYFTPLSREIRQPNPWNAEAYLAPDLDPALRLHLSTAPWSDTMLDGMRGGWRDDLQDFYSIPTSMFTLRMFYNIPMVEQATGSKQPPRTFGEIMTLCDKLRSAAKSEDRAFDPIAGTQYILGAFANAYLPAFSSAFQAKLDRDHDGIVTAIETWAGLEHHDWHFTDPAVADYYGLMRMLCTQFNPSFAAMDRDQAMAAFASGRSAFMASGSWDAESVFRAAKFDVGVMPFPLPAAGDAFGGHGQWGVNEASATGGGAFGLVKTSKHPQEALDFLRFLSSHKWNQQHNLACGWLPVVLGTKPKPAMLPFMPWPYGIQPGLQIASGFDLETRLSGERDKFLNGEVTLTAFQDALTPLLNAKNFGQIWYKSWEGQRDNARTLERTLTVQTARLLLGTGDHDTASRQREVLLDQCLNNSGAGILRLHQQLNPGTAFPEEQ